MSKLKLEHVAPYLPYGLKIMTFNQRDSNGIIEDLKSIDNVVSMVNFGHGNAKDFNEFKPILKPLHELDFDDENESTPEHLQGCCYSYVIYLLEKHFDVFGLIDKGLAININTLDNE